MPKLLLSYRRADSASLVGRIYDRLSIHYGSGSVFRDIDYTEPGTNFREHLSRIINTCDFICVIIGPNWRGPRGAERFAIDNEFDPIRLETEIALEAKKAIIPILIDKADMPSPTILPSSIVELSFRNAVTLDEESFYNDIDRIIGIIDNLSAMDSFSKLSVTELKNRETSAKSNTKIIISYRRKDSSAIVGRLRDRLVKHYGEESIYVDIDNIPFGTSFRTHIFNALDGCRVLLAVVGPYWLGERQWFRRRIFDKNDPIRIEIGTALSKKLPIIPILLDDAVMPNTKKLPEELQVFSEINAAPLSAGRDFEHHVARILQAIEEILTGPDASRPE
jgi:hypothetical protein